MKKLKTEEWAYSWELPFYYDEEGSLIVSCLDPQRYTFENGQWRLVNTPVEIQMYILTAWLEAGWMRAVPVFLMEAWRNAEVLNNCYRDSDES